jgi:hypothetical protein
LQNNKILLIITRVIPYYIIFAASLIQEERAGSPSQLSTAAAILFHASGYPAAGAYTQPPASTD